MIDPTSKEPGTIIAEVKMSRAAGQMTHLLVEGPTDSQFWRGYCVTEAEIVICGGKSNAEGALLGLEQRRIGGVMAIVDDDMDSILGRASPSNNVMVTDERDLEAMLLSTIALEASIGELIDPRLISRYEKAQGATFRECVIERGSWFGRLRLVSASSRLGVDFHQLSPWKYVDASTWEVDVDRLVNDFSLLANITRAQTDELQGKLPNVGPWSLISGKDAMDLILIALQGLFAHRSTNERSLFANLRIAYRALKCIETTDLWGALQACQEREGMTIVCDVVA